MTFSIVAYCPESKSYGVAVTSSSVCVAARCAWTRSGVGAVATQNLTNPFLGQIGLDLLEKGYSADTVIEMLKASDPQIIYRQLNVVDRNGDCAHFSGSKVLDKHSFTIGQNCCASGNLLANDNVTKAMVDSFVNDKNSDLATRLTNSLLAGLNAGGEVRELQSCGILVADQNGWNTVDLRVDQHDAPLAELDRLLKIYNPMKEGYVSRIHSPFLY